MNVVVVGGGPAGLYLAILLRKADPGIEVTVLERNAPDATFGFGVVFSEETLGSLRDADPETHLAITDTFARWNRVDIRYRDGLLRSRGHSFSAIARKRLLELLQERCYALGADLRFGVEVDEVAGGRPRRRAQTARTASSGGTATSDRGSSPREASTSGSAPTTSSTRSRSSSGRPSTGSSTSTPTRTTST